MASLTHKIFASLRTGGDPAPPSPGPPSGVPPISASPTTTATSSSSPTSAWNERFYHVAVQGCCHGELDRIYDACAAHEQQTGKRIDVLICCGDFQAVRTASDMDSMAVPDKFKVMGDFHKYWSSDSASAANKAAAPYLTIFVGGNHENSDLLAQESYGGFVASNIYYLGHSGVVTVDKCLRVAGISGIFKDQDYDRPYPPRPYAANYGWKKGAYHVRRIEVAKLDAYLQAAQALRTSAAADTTPLVDVFVSHDWPVGITAYGDEAQLLRYKPYFRDDIRRNALGNPHTLRLLRAAKPVYWVAAHLHCYFEATIAHTLAHGADDDKRTSSPAPTKFVALDKCAKGSGFLTFLDLPRRTHNSTAGLDSAAADDAGKTTQEFLHGGSGAARIQRDPLWLKVLIASHPFVALNRMSETGNDHLPRSVPQSVGQRGFDVHETVRELVARHAASLPENNNEMSAAVMSAATTEALLDALHLPPALPLQQQPQQSQQLPRAPFTVHPSAAVVRNGQGRQHTTPQWTESRVDDSDVRREYQRPRTEVDAAAPSAVAHPAPAPASTVPLSFFEDITTTRVPESAPVHPPPPAATKVNVAPSPLGWFEDTTQ